MMNQLLSLADPQAVDSGIVGGKASALARLHRERVPVLPGVVVTAGVFDAVSEAHGWLARAQKEDPTVEHEVLKSSLPSDVSAELARATAALGSLLVVRSSAVGEDGREASWAGQYETVLGVRPGLDVDAAVLRCWASAFSERARTYRACGTRPSMPRMAVLIQPLVEPRCSGVMFTINPLSGSWREMTVEAAWGQPAPLVQGELVPDAYTVRRPRRSPAPVQRVLARVRLEVLEDHVRPQREAWFARADGIAPGPVPDVRVHAPKLRHSELARLCRMGLRVEGLMGGPQDIEWAMTEERRLVVLQARPITTAKQIHRSGPALWTRRFIGERWTEPATPLGWSLMGELLSRFIGYPQTQDRHLGGGPAVRMVRFAPYLNVSVFRHLAFKLPGAPPPQFMMELLPQEEQRRWRRRHAQMPDMRVYRGLLTETIADRRWRRFEPGLWANRRAWARFRDGLGAELRTIDKPSPDATTALARAVRCRDLAEVYVGIHVCSLLWANLLYQVTEGLLSDDASKAVAADALRPAEESMTVKTNHALWRLGRGEITMEDFLVQFGHRAGSSWELFSPRWRDNPEVVRVLAAAAAEHQDPAKMAAAQAALATHARDSLGGWRRRLVGVTQEFLLLRENQRYHFDRLLDVWVRQLRSIEDLTGVPVRFLEALELDALVNERMSVGDARALADVRSAAWSEEVQRREAGDEPQVFLVGSEVVTAEPGVGRIQGIGTSAGVATGRVRILRSVADGDQLEPGDILVARATDPGWTPLFLKAGGVIMELGGMLSHGAVVAREYGLPAVVNVEGATQRLRDGQEVTIDGRHGVVWVK